MMKMKPWMKDLRWKMRGKFRPSEEMWREKRENGEKRDEDEVESEGMCQMKLEMSL